MTGKLCTAVISHMVISIQDANCDKFRIVLKTETYFTKKMPFEAWLKYFL